MRSFSTKQQAETSPIALWIRTGRWLPAQISDPALEVKFNPNHDPANGRFTSGGNGGVGTMQERAGRTDAHGEPQPVRLNDGSTVANPRSPTGILMQPPGVSLEKNVAEGKTWHGAAANLHMYENFKTGGAMDYQRTFGSDGKINKNYIDFGNYNYGAVSAAAGYTLDESQMAAGINNLRGRGDKSGMYFGNPRNQAMIAAGWRDYMHRKIGR